MRRRSVMLVFVMIGLVFQPFAVLAQIQEIQPAVPLTCLIQQQPLSFSSPLTIQTGESYRNVVSSTVHPSRSIGEAPLDLDRNGIVDLIGIRSSALAFTVLLGVTDTRFKGQQSYSVLATPQYVLAGDITRDGYVDIVVGTSTHIALFRNNGTGSLVSAGVLNSGFLSGTVGQIALGDYDGDADLDIAAMDGTFGLVVFQNNGTGSFGSGTGWLIVPIAPRSLRAFNANGDGKSDFVLTNDYTSGVFGVSESVNVIRNLTPTGGALNFTTGPADAYQFNASSPGAITAEFNGDGRIDIIALNDGASGIVPLLNNGDFTFSRQNPVSYGTKTPATAIAYTDLDLDKRADIVTASLGSNQISVLRNQGSANFSPAQRYPVSAPRGLALADVDKDGDIDVITANSTSGLSLLKNLRLTKYCR